jgi:hypothetical protein
MNQNNLSEVYINTVGGPERASYGIYTPGLRVIFWFFLMIQKEHFLEELLTIGVGVTHLFETLG